MPEAIMPIVTGLGTKLIGGLMDKAFQPKQPRQQQAAAPITPAAAKNLFSPEQVQKAQQDYTTAGTAKWNQIMSNMGAAGGTGGADVATAIGDQANKLGVALAGLNTDSGYGADPTANMQSILSGVEKGISPKYSVY